MANATSRAVALILDAVGEEAAVSIVAATMTRTAIRDLMREVQSRFALHLLENGDTRPQIRDRLTQRYGVSHETAYQRINEAIDRRSCQISPLKI